MDYGQAIEVLDNVENGLADGAITEDDVMKAIDKILSMATINAVRKDHLLAALRFLRIRIEWDDYWNRKMTNREAFNAYIRKGIEKQIRYMENMNDQGLVDYTIAVPGYHIEKNIHDELCYFKATNGPMPVGPKDRMIAWLGEEWKGGEIEC